MPFDLNKPNSSERLDPQVDVSGSSLNRPQFLPPFPLCQTPMGRQNRPVIGEKCPVGKYLIK